MTLLVDNHSQPLAGARLARVATLLRRQTVDGAYAGLQRACTIEELEAQTFAITWTPINGPDGLAGYVLQWLLDKCQWRITVHTYREGWLDLLSTTEDVSNRFLDGAEAVRRFEQALAEQA